MELEMQTSISIIKKREMHMLHSAKMIHIVGPPVQWIFNPTSNPTRQSLHQVLYFWPGFFQSWFHPSEGGDSVCMRAYSIGNISVKIPFLFIETRNSFPPSPAPVRSSSHASCMLWYWRIISSSCLRRCWALNNCQARWMVQWRR
jgi:hypothetical protein